jgi:pyrimidine operon attenuation protein / uracil phosphoribosyltransferase
MTETFFNPTDQILDEPQIRQKIKRMAFEIYENNFNESELILAGIQENGFVLARLLGAEITRISGIPTKLISISLHKTEPLQHDITIDPTLENLQDAVVILVDDVLNTGKTLAYSLQPLLTANVRKIETATLINRHHTLYPIHATYTGYSLATTLNDHIRVALTEEQFGAYLI